MFFPWLSALACAGLAIAGPLAGPGSLTSYGGGPQRSNFGGFGIVQDPALGFFIAGSSLRGVNGVYGRSMQVPGELVHHSFMLAYTHYESGWVLALVQAAVAEGSKWLLIDPQFRDRFVQAGGQILPGAGPKWTRLMHDDGEGVVAGGAEQETVGDEDELPWQIVGIMGEQMLQNLRAHFKFHEANTAKVLRGSGLPVPPQGSFESSMREGAWLFRVVDPAVVSVHARPHTNASVVGRMAHGEYARVDVRRQEWLRLSVSKARWGRLPVWVPLHGASFAGPPSLVLVPEEEDPGIADTPEHPDAEAAGFDRPPLIQALANAEGFPVEASAFAGSEPAEEADVGQPPPDTSPPHEAVLKGALGSPSALAARLALGANTTAQLKQGLAQLRQLLANELAIRRQPAEAGGETTALLLRLTLVRVLLSSRQGAEALREAKAAALAHPTSSAAHFWLGRCELRLGHRQRGLAALEAAVEVSHFSVAGNPWGYAGANAYLRLAKGMSQLQRSAEADYAAGDYDAARLACGKALALATRLREDRWGRARLHADRAVVLRRLRAFPEALADIEAALGLFPRYARALFCRGLVLLELGRPQEAVHSFEHVLRVDRQWPQLCAWLSRAHSQARRAEKAQGAAPGTAEDDLAEDFYALLEVSADFTQEELKKAFRAASLKHHPDKPGGSERAFRRVAAAYEALADDEKRKAYDEGRDLQSSLFEDIERRYFPDRYGFWPFGDPFEQKRRLRAMRQRRSAREGSKDRAWEF